MIIIDVDLYQMGQRIKEVRLRHKKTQQEVADDCDISKSLLSKIENGQTSSAVATLSKICQALNVPLSWVLDNREETDLVLQPDYERRLTADNEMGYSYELLANRANYSQIEPTIVHVTPKDTNVRQEPYTHLQDEFIYVIEGEMYLLYDGVRHRMRSGDTAYFKGKNPHLFIPIDNEGAKVLTVFIED